MLAPAAPALIPTEGVAPALAGVAAPPPAPEVGAAAALLGAVEDAAAVVGALLAAVLGAVAAPVEPAVGVAEVLHADRISIAERCGVPTNGPDARSVPSASSCCK